MQIWLDENVWFYLLSMLQKYLMGRVPKDLEMLGTEF